MAYREHGGQPYHFTVMSYDERGRPEALLRYTENLGFEAIHYEYNSMNKLIRITAADPLRRHTTWYGYDNNGRVDSVWTAVDTVGSGTLLHGKPNDWGLENYVQQRPIEASITYTYTRTGKVDTMYYPQINVATWYHYTPRKWLDTLVATNGLVDLFRQELSYNNVGHITKQFSRQHGAPPNTQLYAYDAIGQLKTWSLNPLDIFNGTVQVYGYDDVGNRTSTTDFQGDPSMLQGSQSYSIGPDISNPTAGPNQLLKVQSYDATSTATDYTTFAYDPDGSMTMRTQYDPLGTPLFDDRYSYSSWRGLTTGFEREDLLAPQPGPQVLWNSEYSYNAMGTRERKRVTREPQGNAQLPGYSWDYVILGGRGNQLINWQGGEVNGGNPCGFSLGEMVFLYPEHYKVSSWIGALTLFPNNEHEYNIADYSGSVRTTIDGTGVVVSTRDYEPFGVDLNVTGSMHGEGWLDHSSIEDNEPDVHLGARVYDNNDGRFLRPDPVLDLYTSTSPYSYAFNSPINFHDASGETVNFFKVFNSMNAETGEWRPTSGGGIIQANMIVEELRLVTGLDLYYDENLHELTLASNEVNGGSVTARNLLLEMINSDVTIDVIRGVANTTTGSGFGNVIYLNPVQMLVFREGANGVAELTMSYGVSFFHEYFHTLAGGSHRDDVGGTGVPVDVANIIRGELGLDWGQRVQYMPIKVGNMYYIPFSEDARTLLLTGQVPVNGGYVMMSELDYASIRRVADMMQDAGQQGVE